MKSNKWLFFIILKPCSLHTMPFAFNLSFPLLHQFPNN